jgi:hypothetical protein
MFTDPTLPVDLLVNVAVAIVAGGLCLSPLGTKLKDLFKGVPSDLRTALNNVETDATAKFKAATAPVPVKLPASPAAAAVAAAAAAVAAPAAPAPAATVILQPAPAPLTPLTPPVA